mgnify:CR=1 FL=1
MLEVGQKVYVIMPDSGQILHLRVSQLETEEWGEVVEGETGYMYTAHMEYLHTGTKVGKFMYGVRYNIVHYMDKLPDEVYTDLLSAKAALAESLCTQIQQQEKKLSRLKQKLEDVDYIADKSLVLDVKQATGKSLTICIDAVTYTLGDRDKAIKLTKYL